MLEAVGLLPLAGNWSASAKACLADIIAKDAFDNSNKTGANYSVASYPLSHPGLRADVAHHREIGPGLSVNLYANGLPYNV